MNSTCETRPIRKSLRPNKFYIKYNSEQVEFIDANSREVKCGDIWMANLPDANGSIQGGNRPVFVISNNKNNYYSTTINVIPLTTKMNKRNLPCHVEISDYKKYGLFAPSTLLIEQTTTIKKDSLTYYMGKIEDIYTLEKICDAMRSQFSILTY